MSTQGWRQNVIDFIEQEAKPREKFGHQVRLYALTQEVGRGLNYDDDVVFAAAWLHDLGVFTGHRPEDLAQLAQWDNTRYAMEQTPRLLTGFGFPSSKIAAVVETIRTHQPFQVPTGTEGEILRDSDILEQLGAIGVLRTVCKVGRDTRFEDFTAAVKSLEKALQSLPPLIHLETTRALAASRIEALEAFLHSVRAEASSNLY